MKSECETITCTLIFITTLVTIANIQNQTRFTSINEITLSHKGNGILSFEKKNAMKAIVLHEICQYCKKALRVQNRKENAI